MVLKNENSASIWELDRPKSVKDQVIDRILTGIADGHLPVGAPLPSETVLCREMGVSRVALREAVKQLEALGFLNIERGSGTVVTRPDFRCLEMVVESLGRTRQITFKDFHEVRSLIEVEAVGQVAGGRNDELVGRLEEILDEASRNIDKELGYVDLDFRLHKEILNACPNKLLSMFLAPFDNYLRKSRRLSFTDRRAAEHTIEAHSRIIDAIRKKDPERARQSMKEHLAEAARDLRLY